MAVTTWLGIKTNESFMHRIPVSSSNIRAIGYEPASQTLEVEFRDGSVYQYFGVPESIHSTLMAANSHGRYFDAHVKKAPYRYRQVR